MPRGKGQRSPGFAARREELIRLARWRLSQRDGGHVSLRDIATACGATVPTLTHYFGKREDLITAVMEQQLQDGAPHLAFIADTALPFQLSVREVADYIVFGFQQGLGEVFSVGLIEGLRNPIIGPHFLSSVMEPTLEATGLRLNRHISLGEMRPVDEKSAALTLVAPVLLVCLHQQDLNGSKKWPLSMETFLQTHCDGFVRAYTM
jgi:AcrR family transcriptional regulator